MVKKISIRTGSGTNFHDITSKISEVVSGSGVKEGLCQIYVPHTTAGLTINENADPSVPEDIMETLEKLIPEKGRYRHSEGNSHAHIKSSILGHSHSVIVKDGKLMLGTWQGIFFCEFDGPRTREVWIKLIS